MLFKQPGPLLLLGWFLLRRTVFGRYVYAIGSNSSAATKSGIDVRFYTMLVYAMTGLTSGIGAVVMTARVGAAQPVAAPTLTLESIAAIVLGGVALAGGSGSIVHVVLGTIILGMMSNALNMVGISAYYQMLAIGLSSSLQSVWTDCAAAARRGEASLRPTSNLHPRAVRLLFSFLHFSPKRSTRRERT